MNEKRTALLTVCLLGAFLLTFSLWAYLKPDDAFSQSERRKLTPKPSCTVESIYSGRYMSDFETYAPDQFPLREQFRTLRSLTSLYLLRQRDTNGVYLAEGYVCDQTPKANEEVGRGSAVTATPPGALTTCTTPISPVRTAGCICR